MQDADQAWAGDFLDRVLVLWRQHANTPNGLFNPYLDRQWRHDSDGPRTLVSQCRLIYVFSRAYERSGDKTYADLAQRGIAALAEYFRGEDGGWVWVTGAENNAKAKVKALVTERVGKGVAWMPFHFGGWFGGDDLRANYPAGTDPIVLGESANTITTYGYDPATGMQEPKVTLCQIRAA